ncbi:MAG: DUF4394 domain-containing protein [Rubrivivax sp.]
MIRIPTKGRTLALLAVPALLLAVGSVQAVPIVGLTSANEIARIETSNLSSSTRAAITGLAAGDRFVGIDLRPGDNKIYGITLSNKIYTVNEFTGATTFVANLSENIVLSTLGYGVDFNPNADFTGGSSLRFTSTAGSNYAINPMTGVVGNQGSNIGAGFSGAAYTNSSPFPTTQPSTSLYYINSSDNTLRFAPNNFNSPTIQTIGPLGIDALRANGFEILGNGTAYAALNVDEGSSLVTGIYTINLATGAATLVGNYNGTLSGLTASAVPEVGTYALMALGLGAIGFTLRRRRQA